MSLPTSKDKMYWITKGIDNGINFCSLSTTTCSNKLVVFGI